MRGMEVISPSRTVQRRAVAPVIAGTMFGTVLLVSGVVLAYLAYLTPFLTWLVPTGVRGPGEMVMGALTWSVALVAPAGLLLLGTNRLARILAATRRRIPRRSPLQVALASLPGDVALATGLTLPDGRGISDVLVGPFGAAVFRELPPAHVTRIREGNWALRTSRGWAPLENPLDRASRDAERVRRWLAHEDADFVDQGVRRRRRVAGDDDPANAVLRGPDARSTRGVGDGAAAATEPHGGPTRADPRTWCATTAA